MTAVSANLPVTVITIGRNSLMGLQETVASVRSQTYEPLRHVVIDGDSTDGSVEWLRTHANQAECMWISEPDAGIYDAMNKALIHVDGGYLLYLHAGDTFVDQDAVQRSMAAIGGGVTAARSCDRLVPHGCQQRHADAVCRGRRNTKCAHQCA